MFWKNSKPKESSSTAIVRQDSRTTVKTSTAQSETTSTSVQNDTIFNDNNNTVAYRTTTQTVTHQQQARITEILRRYTPTPEELAEMRAAIFGETKTTTTNSSSKRKPTQLPAIEYVGGATGKNNSPLSPLVFNYDSPRAYSTTTTTTSGGGSSRGKPTTPTIVKVQTTTVTSKEGRTVTSQVQQQRIQIGGSRPYNLSSPQTTRRLAAASLTPMTTKYEDRRQLDAKPFNLSSPKSTISTKLLPATKGSTAFGGGSSVYQSPYLQRSIYAPTTQATTKSPTTAKTRLEPPPKAKPATNTKLNWLTAPVTSTTATNKGSNNSINMPSSSTSRFGEKTPNLPPKTSGFSTTPAASSNGIFSKKKSKLQPGYVYIFNNETFDNPSNEYRVGSSVDVKLLRKTFEEYKLKVNLIENATLDKIDSTVKKIETKDYSNNSCIVIVILSHGSRHEEVCAKDGTYSIDDKILFPILRNRTLNDKPKIMFIQACKGAMEIGGFHKDAVQPLGSPNEIFKCYSTFEGYVSYRTENGSIFIQSVCEFLKMFGGIKSIKDIMEMVCLRVKQKSDNKQIPAIMSTLTQPYVFGDYV